MSLQTDVITGVNAVVNNFPTMGYVEIERTTDTGPIYDSGGQGGADRLAGNIDFTGRVMAYGYKPPSGAFPNQDFALSFTQNSSASPAENISCAGVKCTALEIVVPMHDPGGRNAIYYVLHFAADGLDLTLASSGGPAPSNVVTKYTSKGVAPYLSSGTSMNRETYCQWQHLLITAETERKINSDTGGVYFRPAGSLDWKFSYNREVNTMALLPALNRIATIEMQTNPKVNGGPDSGAGSVGYWLLQYGIVGNYRAKIDHASRLPISYDVTLEKCNNGTSGFGIWNPDGVSMYPTYSG